MLIDAALEYARKGFAVFPLNYILDSGVCSCEKGAECTNAGKHPLGLLVPHGHKDASTDEAQIKAWWTENPRANIGIVIGEDAGILVFDIESVEGHKVDGFSAIQQLEAEHGEAFSSDTYAVKSATGGAHYYSRYPTELKGKRLKKYLADGVELKYKGYVVAPPSVTRKGEYKLIHDAELADVMPAWVKLCEQPEPIRPPRVNGSGGPNFCDEHNITMFDVCDVPSNRQHGKEIIFSHPLHGSDSGTNFHVTADGRVWSCKRCDSGGDALTWVAVREGFIKCEEAITGLLQSDPDLSTRCCNVLRRELGIEEVSRSSAEHIDNDELPAQAIEDGARERAINILKTSSPRDFILNTFKTQHIGDVETAEGILIGTANQSLENSKGVQAAVFGESGRGKSHAARAMLHLFPRAYFMIASLSNKALFYLESDKLRAGMTIFSDDARINEGIEDIIKRSTGFYQEYTTNLVATKEGGKWVAKELTIPPRINWLLTSVSSQGSEQLINRQIAFGVDESTEQDEKVMAFELMKAREGLPEFEITDDVLTCREIIRNIKEDDTGTPRLFRVKIDFADRIEWLDTVNRRNLPIFLDMIKGYAVLNFMQRETVNGFLIATEADFKAAERLYNTRGGFQSLHINEREKEMLQHIVANGGDIATAALMDKMKLSGVRVRQIADRLETVLPRFGIEKRSERVGDPSDTGKSTNTQRNYFCYSGDVTVDLFGSVVSLRGESDFNHFNPTLTPLKGVKLKVGEAQNEGVSGKEGYNNNNNNNNIRDKVKTEVYTRARTHARTYMQAKGLSQNDAIQTDDISGAVKSIGTAEASDSNVNSDLKSVKAGLSQNWRNAWTTKKLKRGDLLNAIKQIEEPLSYKAAQSVVYTILTAQEEHKHLDGTYFKDRFEFLVETDNAIAEALRERVQK